MVNWIVTEREFKGIHMNWVSFKANFLSDCPTLIMKKNCVFNVEKDRMYQKNVLIIFQGYISVVFVYLGSCCRNISD